MGLLTGDDLFNWLAMLRTTDKRTFFVLEGPTDCQSLDPHLLEDEVATFPAHSKSAAKRTLELVESHSLDRVLVVLDRDWVDVLEARESSPNVVYTDDYDLDVTVLFAGTVLDRVVMTHSDRNRRNLHLAAVGVSAENLLVQLAGPVGVLRFVSERDRLGINCAGFPMHAVMASANDSVDLEQAIVLAVSRSGNTIDRTTLLMSVDREVRSTSNLRWFCNGHDVASALAALLKYWGGAASRVVVETAARSAFSCADLRATRLYADVTAWATSAGVPAVWSCA